MRKKTYLRLKKKRKILRRQQRKPHDRLWTNIKGLTKINNIDKVSNKFVDICDKANRVTKKLRAMGYYDSDLKSKRIKTIKIKKRAS